MFQLSTKRALRREVSALHEQVLDQGEALTRLTTHVVEYRKAFVAAFVEAGEPLPGVLRDDDRPSLTVIHGDGAR